jgi:hypothetical protein
MNLNNHQGKFIQKSDEFFTPNLKKNLTAWGGGDIS